MAILHILLTTQISHRLWVPAAVAAALSGVPVVEIALVESHGEEVLLVIIEGRERHPQCCRNPEEAPRCHVSVHLKPAITPSQLPLSCHGPQFVVHSLRHN